MSVKACLNLLPLRMAFQLAQHALGAEMACGVTPFYPKFRNGLQYEDAFGNAGMGKNQLSRSSHEPMIIDNVEIQGTRTPLGGSASPRFSLNCVELLQQRHRWQVGFYASDSVYEGRLIGPTEGFCQQQARRLDKFEAIAIQRPQSLLHALLRGAPGARYITAYRDKNHDAGDVIE
jgi:hypothetical protein